MGAVSGMLGLAGGQSGTGIQGPTGANITSPVTGSQLSNAYTGAQAGMSGQQDLLAALQRQNGLDNQSNVYNQMQGVANGTGLNPAQAMLNQTTGQNVAQQAALMAGQRGAASNVGLMARQAGMQGANIQQQAAGQGAVMQANQSLNALGQLGGMANAQAANQIGQTNANTQAQQQEQQALLNAQGQYNQAQAGSQASVNAANAGLANTQMGNQANMLGGIFNAAGAGGMMGQGVQKAAGAGALMAQGGPVSSIGQHFAKMAMGGDVPVVLSPGEKLLDPSAVEAVKNGANPMAVGKTVPGKPKVGGTKNSYANDTYETKAPEGSIVVPRSETKSKNPNRASSEFVHKVLAKRQGGRK